MYTLRVSRLLWLDLGVNLDPEHQTRLWFLTLESQPDIDPFNPEFLVSNQHFLIQPGFWQINKNSWESMPGFYYPIRILIDHRFYNPTLDSKTQSGSFWINNADSNILSGFNFTQITDFDLSFCNFFHFSKNIINPEIKKIIFLTTSPWTHSNTKFWHVDFQPLRTSVV